MIAWAFGATVVVGAIVVGEAVVGALLVETAVAGVVIACTSGVKAGVTVALVLLVPCCIVDGETVTPLIFEAIVVEVTTPAEVAVGLASVELGEVGAGFVVIMAVMPLPGGVVGRVDSAAELQPAETTRVTAIAERTSLLRTADGAECPCD